jgi:dTDP-D-glucose 4,6-dehydratase
VTGGAGFIGDVRQDFAAIDPAAAELDYSLRTRFNDGLRQYIDWYRSNPATAKTQGNALEKIGPGHRPG